MQNWTKNAIDCYNRHLIEAAYKSHSCKTLLNGSMCENYKGDKCNLTNTIKKIFAQKGPPTDLPVIRWEINPKPLKLTDDEKKIVNLLILQKSAVLKEFISEATKIHASCIASRISRINQKRPNLITIIKIDGRSNYKLNAENLEDLKC